MTSKQRGRMWLILLTAVLGALISAMLLNMHLDHQSSLHGFCSFAGSETFDCEKVNASLYSRIFGIPVATLGLFFFGLMCLWMLFALAGRMLDFVALPLAAALVASVVSVFFVGCLAIVSTMLIGAVCTFCALTWLAAGLILFLMAGAVKSEKAPRFFLAVFCILRDGSQALFDVKRFGALSLLFVSTSLGLVWGIWVGSDRAEARISLTQLEKQVEWKQRIIREYYKSPKIDIDLVGVPVIAGNPNAPVTLVEYVDFGCPVCKKELAETMNVVMQHAKKVRLHVKSIPGDSQCNRHVKESEGGAVCRASWVAASFLDSPHYRPFFLNLMRFAPAVSDQEVRLVLQQMGMDPDVTVKEASDDEVKARVQRDIEELVASGADGVPVMVLNDRLLAIGPIPPDVLELMILIESHRAEKEPASALGTTGQASPQGG